MLKIELLKKAYGTSCILDIVDLTLPNGCILIKGSNGAGKSTFLRCISGIIQCDSSITLDEVSLNKNPVAYKKLIRYSEAEPSFPSFLSANDLLKFMAKSYRIPAFSADRFIDLFEMKGFIDQPISTYSSGMLKKTSLLLAFLGNPRWILLDEPFTTIDPKSQEVLLQLIDELKSQRINFIISTHTNTEILNIKFERSFELNDQKLILI